MSRIQFHRMEVLKSLYDLTAAITPNRFISSRPPATGEPMDDFLLIRLPQTIRDRGDTYQSTWGQIAVFAKDVQEAFENTLRLEQMQAAVMDLFPIVTECYHAKLPRLLPGGTDGTGFHSLIIQFKITIFKTSKTI